MLKNRVIAVIILRHGEVVQSVQFKHTNVIHKDPRFAVEYFSKWDADEIILLDVSRDVEKRDVFLQSVDELSKTCFVPMTVGGWIKTADEIKDILAMGADKVVINSEAFARPDFIEEAARRFGSQCIVVGIDCRRNEQGEFVVFTDRGREDTGMQARDWAAEAEKRGAGEIFLSSIDHDGKRIGFDLELMNQVCEAVSIPVIAFGGALMANHLAQCLQETSVDAVSAANMFHYSENSMKKAKRALREKDLKIRQ